MSDGGISTVDRFPFEPFEAQEREQRFMGEIRNHLEVLGANVLFEKLSSAYRFASARASFVGTTSAFSPTETLIAAFADTDGWDRVLLAIAAILAGDRRVA